MSIYSTTSTITSFLATTLILTLPVIGFSREVVQFCGTTINAADTERLIEINE